jgi:thiol:disulfide interchange protein DsbD
MRCANFLLAAWAAWLAAPAHAQFMTKAKLVLEAQAAKPGETVLAGVQLQIAPRWHVYWRNPGETGIPVSIEWTLPDGVTADPIQWPVPEVLKESDLTAYVYQIQASLIVPIRLAPTLKPGPVRLAAKVSWLECEVACVQGNQDLEASLTIGPQRAPSAEAAVIQAAQNRLPGRDPGLELQTRWEKPPTGDTGTLLLEGAVKDGFQPADFFAYGASSYELAPAVKVLPSPAGRFLLSKTLKRTGDAFPKRVEGILVQPGKDNTPSRAVEVALIVPEAAVGTPATVAKAGAGTSGTMSATASQSLWFMLMLAFVGGLILNVMPCVLPVIALKILGFVNQSREAPARVRRLGLLYAVGVVVSFEVLAGMVIAVQGAGGAASWGMQMQNPYFRLALTVVVMLVALNLFGLFEITLGSSALGSAAGLAAKEGGWGAFFNGVLATALATPCTAPFLTVALGFAFTQSAGVILLMFAATAVGLAAPYVLLSWRPEWLRFLPKPGAWMERFKVAMGFPMLATGVWLFDLTAPSFGEGGVLWLGLVLVVVALAAWIWGEFVQRGVRRRGLAMAACGALLLLGYVVGLEGQLHWRKPSPLTAGGTVIRDGPDGIEWRAWSSAAVEQARAAGHPVLVDFTARWCLTCKSNKKLAIDVPPVRTRLKQLDAVSFRADNTDPNPAITAELKRYERAGVPLVLLFPAKPDEPPFVLPALLTQSIVLDYLSKVAN